MVSKWRIDAQYLVNSQVFCTYKVIHLLRTSKLRNAVALSLHNPIYEYAGALNINAYH